MSALRRLLAGGFLLTCCAAILLAGAPAAQKLHPFFQQALTGRPHLEGALQTGSPYDAIIYTANPDAIRAAGVHVNSVFPQFVTAQITPRDIERLAGMSEVQYLDPGSVNYPVNDVSMPETGASLLHGGLVNSTHYMGQGAIVVIYDTGIDWKHSDFCLPGDGTKTRILFIWDQTLTPTAGEMSPSGLGYGVEYTKAQIEDEIDGSPAGFVREKDTNGHGTHVAGTAAGNGGTFGGKYAGMAPMADIIVVKGGDNSFSESRMIDGMTYAQAKAGALGKPVVINYSIGGQGGPHDGSRSYEVAMDTWVSTPGRVVVVSAGNDGGDPIHIAGTIPAAGMTTFTFTVPTYTPTAGVDNDSFSFDAWFAGSPNVSTMVTSPTGIMYTRGAGEFGDGPVTTDGTIWLENITSTLNSEREVYLYVHDATTNVPKTGTWTLAITNTSGGQVAYDAWLTSKTVGSASVALTGGGFDKTVGMPGTSAGAITVGAYATKWGWPVYTGQFYSYSAADRTGNITAYSSIGPTRDGRLKPDIAAPGQGISSALSSSVDTTGKFSSIHPGQRHQILSGTSMAAPHVTGACALLLGANPSLTAAQVKTLIASTANVDAFASGLPNNTWGYGKLDIVEAVAKSLNGAATVLRKTFAYDVAGSSQTRTLAGLLAKYAVRFTPDVNGMLTGVQMNVTSNSNGIVGTGNMQYEIYSNSGGVPGTKIGNSVLVPLGMLCRGTYNYTQLLNANVPVTSGTDYFIVASVPGTGDTVRVRQDLGSVASDRSFLFDGSGWVAITPNNLRIRAIVTSGSGVSSVEPAEGVAMQYELLQNYPNPFNPTTSIRFSIPERNRVSLKIYDLLGRQVTELMNEEVVAGKYQVEWNAAGMATGTYFYRLQAGNFAESKKLLLLK
jgi:subtilisin family serine protease